VVEHVEVDAAGASDRLDDRRAVGGPADRLGAEERDRRGAEPA
jgi:hypothetical protein